MTRAATQSVPTAHPPDGLLIKAARLWELLAISPATGARWMASGRLLAPIRFGSGKSTLRWRMDEVREWISAGCPTRAEWEARRRRR
jgi:predicted DNA-binding transcriptional regulator AlpA